MYAVLGQYHQPEQYRQVQVSTPCRAQEVPRLVQQVHTRSELDISLPSPLFQYSIVTHLYDDLCLHILKLT